MFQGGSSQYGLDDGFGLVVGLVLSFVIEGDVQTGTEPSSFLV